MNFGCAVSYRMPASRVTLNWRGSLRVAHHGVIPPEDVMGAAAKEAVRRCRRVKRRPVTIMGVNVWVKEQQ